MPQSILDASPLFIMILSRDRAMRNVKLVCVFLALMLWSCGNSRPPDKTSCEARKNASYFTIGKGTLKAYDRNRKDLTIIMKCNYNVEKYGPICTFSYNLSGDTTQIFPKSANYQFYIDYGTYMDTIFLKVDLNSRINYDLKFPEVKFKGKVISPATSSVPIDPCYIYSLY